MIALLHDDGAACASGSARSRRLAARLRAALALIAVSASIGAVGCENPRSASAPAPAPASVHAEDRSQAVRQPEASVARRALGRGDRFGEVWVVRRNGFSGEAQVWGTQGVNDCPAAQWNALDAEKIRSDAGAFRVILNGPRVWLPNATEGPQPSAERATFGELEMGLVTTFKVERGQDSTPYRERRFRRTAKFTFTRGEEVYELATPEGVVYVMQSMSRIVDPDLTLDELRTLDARLSLPRGWTYRARKLEADLVLAIEGEAVVIQDDLKNTYLRM